MNIKNENPKMPIRIDIVGGIYSFCLTRIIFFFEYDTKTKFSALYLEC